MIVQICIRSNECFSRKCGRGKKLEQGFAEDDNLSKLFQNEQISACLDTWKTTVKPKSQWTTTKVKQCYFSPPCH